MAGARNIEVAERDGFLLLTFDNATAVEIQREKVVSQRSYSDIVLQQCSFDRSRLQSSADLDGRFRRHCTEVTNLLKRAAGRQRQEILVKVSTIRFPLSQQPLMAPLAEPGEVSTGELQQERLDERDEVTRLAALVQELEAKVRGLEDKCSFLEVRNRHLEALDKSRRTTRNSGKVVGAGSSKTDKRRLETAGAVLNAAGEDLLRSYGLELSAAFVRDRSDRVHKITLDRDVIVVESNLAHVFQGNKARTFSDLTPEDKQIVSDIVALLDDHYVSDAFWKKLSSSLPNLPPLRLLISCRERLDCTTTITRTPGKTRGAQVSFNVELSEALRNVCVKEGVTPDDLSRERLVVKVEGDGCNVSRRTSWTTLSFLVVRGGQALQNPKLHRLLAVSEAAESYFSIRESFGDLFEEINAVVRQEQVSLDGATVPLAVCLGGDLKFVLLVLGLQSAASKYPCPFCRATDADRTNPALPASHFNQPPLARTRENLRSDCDSKNHGVQYRPLLDIDPGSIIPDVLHMKMRIMNRLLECVLMEFEDLDDEAQLRNPDATKQEHVDGFVELVRSCGVKFSVFKDETKRSFTSLTGSDADRLLHCLPQKLEGKLHRGTEQDVIGLWKMLQQIFNHLATDTSGRTIEAEAHSFLVAFLRLGQSDRRGYGRSRVTPYMHILAHHVSAKHERMGCLEWFSSQGLEKKNDVLKKIHHCRTNKWNAAADALRLAKRLESHSGSHRVRAYSKQDAEYWFGGGIEASRRKRARSAPDGPSTSRAPPADYDAMSAGELRTELAALGVRTGAKNVGTLKRMLRSQQGH